MHFKSQPKTPRVFVSGCYDLLHSGHVEFFRQAAEYGDLYVKHYLKEETTKSQRTVYRIISVDDSMGLDIGPKTEELFEKEVSSAKMVVWNGPLGVYEFSKYKENTDTLLKYLVDNNIKTILGGGDIVAAASAAGYKDKVYHASTGGGATLEYMEGKELPGVVAIK